MIKFFISGCVLLLFISCNHKKNIDAKNYDTEIKSLFLKAQKENYNTDYVIIVDYSIHSGLERGFIIDKDHKLIKAFLLAHGSGSGTQNGKPIRFSNVDGSFASSLGLAVLDRRDYSSWGIKVKYWLKGLEESNSNLKSRVVVLHSWEGIPDENIYPREIVESQGCPTVSNNTMREIDALVKQQQNKKILILFRV